MGADIYKLKLAAEKAEVLLLAIDAIEEVTLAIQAITPEFSNLNSVAANLLNIIAVANNETNINAVKNNESNIDTIVSIQAMLTTISNDALKLTSLYTDKAKLDSLYADKATLDALFGMKITLDSLYADKTALASLYADKTKLDALHGIIAQMQALYANIDTMTTNAQNIAAIQGALQNATDALNAKDQTLIYRNQAEGFKNEAQAIAGGTIVASNVQFSDLISLEVWRTNTANAINTINTLLASNDTNLDDIQELVDFIKANKATLDTLGIGNIAGLQTALDAKSTEIAAHANNVANPHGVTKVQVGLSNVDNTSDASKPLSDAAIAALALKLSIATSALCTQGSITDDPNNATQEYILTKHANCPDANVSYWYIHTIFYTAQTNGAPRSQMAYAYTGSNAVYNRHYISGAWSAWTRVDKEAVDATSSVKGIDFKGLLAEFEVTGSPVTSINFSGLDINTHKSYRVEIDNVSNGASYIALFVNGDNTQTNYYTQQIFTTSATVSGTNSNASRFGYQAAEDNLATVSATIHKGANGLVTFESLCSCDRNESACFFGRKTGTVANVTQLTFTHALTNGFGVGSKIRIYRGDV